MAIELASAYVSLIPSLKGAAKSITAGLGGVNIAPAANSIGKQLSAGIGKSLKSSVNAAILAPVNAAIESQAAATAALGGAERDLAKARAGQQAAQAKVAAAEEKLNALRESGEASAAELQTAEANLNSAKVALADTNIKVGTSEDAVTRAREAATAANNAYSDSLKTSSTLSGRVNAALPIISDHMKTVGASWQTAGKKISDVGSSLATKVTLPAAGAAAAVGGVVAGLGFKRLVGIDTARGQFKGLGHDADAVMKQVDAGVTGTALSMADGASMAVGILATGAVPLEELEAQIQRTANVSAAYGVEGSHAANLLNAVLTKNKVTYGDLSQMQQNGIPIISQLADHYGVAGDKIEKMASEGKISIEDLNKVLDKNAGSAAEEYSKTWAGVTANIRSNLGRLGAELLDGVFPQLKSQAEGFLEILRSDDAKAFAQDIGGRLSEAFSTLTNAIKGAFEWFTGLSPVMQNVVLGVAGFALAAGPVLIVVGKLATGIGAIISVTGSLVGALGPAVTLVGRFGGAIKAGFGAARIGAVMAGSAMKTAITGTLTAIRMQAQYALAMARTAAGAVAQGVAFAAQRVAMVATTVAMKAAAVAQRLFNIAMNANPIVKIITLVSLLVAGLVWFFTQTKIGQELWSGFMSFLGNAWETIKTWFSVGIAFISALWQTGWTAISTFFSGIWAGMQAAFTAIWSAITGAVQAGIEFVRAVISTVLNAIKNVWSNAWQWQMTLFQNIWEGIRSFAQKAIDWVRTAISNGLNAIRTVWSNIWNGIRTFFSNVWNGIVSFVQSAINNVKSRVQAGVNAVRSVWNSVWSGIRTFFSNIWSSIVSAASSFIGSVKSTFSSALDFIRGIPGKVVGFFTGLGSRLIESGKSLIGGFISGVRKGFDNAVGAVKDGLAKVRSFFPFSPAKEGPFSGRGWVSYSGLSLGKTFSESVAKSLSDGRKDISSELDGIENEFNREGEAGFRVSSATPATGTLSGGHGADSNGGLTIHVENMTVDSDSRVKELGQELWSRQNRANRARGRVAIGGVVE